MKESILSVDLVAFALRSEDTPAGQTRESLTHAQVRYEKFLCLCAKNPDRSLAPTRDIDMMWHFHMLNPRSYVNDCFKLFGDILDHDGGFGSTPEEEPELRRVFEETAQLWRQEFNEEYRTQHPASQMVRCTRNCVSRCKRACKTRTAA